MDLARCFDISRFIFRFGSNFDRDFFLFFWLRLGSVTGLHLHGVAPGVGLTSGLDLSSTAATYLSCILGTLFFSGTSP